ncbi:hypothetical protein ACKWTF_007786 [Chironomus riparius]
MFLKVILICILSTLTYGSPIIYNQNYNHPNTYLTPPRAITTLNTFVPIALIPPAPPRANIPRIYETPKSRIYTAPPIFRTIPPAPTTKRPFFNKTHNHHNLKNNNYNPGYAYNYSVNDNRTGDIKNVEERLENGVVRGSYSLLEADGTTVRRVTYTADDVNGFVANVERTNVPINNNNNANVANNNNNNTRFTIFTP